LFFALVDLKNFEELPDVFMAPSKVIASYFAGGPEEWPRARYHESVETLDPYKNDWKTISDRLSEREEATHLRALYGQNALSERHGQSPSGQSISVIFISKAIARLEVSADNSLFVRSPNQKCRSHSTQLPPGPFRVRSRQGPVS
jgi:hypothetical protein